ncbi:extracellular solute-binding protein [Parasphingopyxis sp.]|uniref:extracellular solute-binding protein n=1 Tax=Parasphingopyxis sp. TaxID=1920299 RepID=UPI00261956EB|nr:extracellular solute-binding protein [Parasphingopyxis sp.]
MRILPILAIFTGVVLASCGSLDSGDGSGAGEGQTLTIYSSRHYDSDYALYEAFEEETGVTVEAIEADGDLLIERVKAAGDQSPADVIITVDAGRLWRAEQEELFAPVSSAVLEERVPANMRHPDGLWFAVATRARVIVYAEDRVDGGDLTGYASLADPAFRRRVCARSSGNVYNISLLAALIDRWGSDTAQQWANGVNANFARDPLGGDSDQIRAVAAGECDVAIVNHYYFARLMGTEPEVTDGLAVFWPNAEAGVHVNISGMGMSRNAPNPELAQQFLEFAVSDRAQRFFAELTNEYPAVASVTYENAALAELGDFEADPLAATVLGENQAEAQRLFDRAGWQ